MENLKIKVNSESESKEARELFFKLGYSNKAKFTEQDFIRFNGWICALDDGSCDYSPISGTDREITLKELRNMVNPMKEYLEKQADGSYKLVMRGIVGKDGDIEVPGGADCARNTCGGLEFYKDNLNLFFSISGDCWKNTISTKQALSQNIVWQRHTQPEELPFMDSLNDQYAEIEQVRQQTIEATLAERQAQYGSFVGVANTTGALMAVIKNSKNGSTLPYAHEEALHMICSKIARIVNGDHNHKDSWHDIGGYSKLIEDLL